MGEKYVQEEFLGEESLGEKSVQEEFLGEESLGEKYMGEKYVQEKKLGEESLCEKYMGEKSVQEEFLGEKSLGEKYMGEMYWRVAGWKVWWKIGVDGMLAFLPPFSGFRIQSRIFGPQELASGGGATAFPQKKTLRLTALSSILAPANICHSDMDKHVEQCRTMSNNVEQCRTRAR